MSFGLYPMQTELRPASEETDGNIDQFDDSSKIGTLKLWIRRKALSTSRSA
jgi:hypothetical protein